MSRGWMMEDTCKKKQCIKFKSIMIHRKVLCVFVLQKKIFLHVINAWDPKLRRAKSSYANKQIKTKKYDINPSLNIPPILFFHIQFIMVVIL